MNEKLTNLLTQCKAVKNCKMGPLFKAQQAETALYLAADLICTMADKITALEKRLKEVQQNGK